MVPLEASQNLYLASTNLVNTILIAQHNWLVNRVFDRAVRLDQKDRRAKAKRQRLRRR